VQSFLPVVVGALLGIGLLAQKLEAVRRRPINAVLSAAAHEAGSRGHELITLEHLMLSLSYDDGIESLIVSKGIDADRLREGLREELARVTVTPDLKTLPELDSRAELVVRLASARRAYPTPRSLFDAIEDGPDSCARTLLAARGEPRSNPEPPADASGPYRSPPRPGTTAVRLWNDKRTTVACVVGALVEHVGVDESRACYLAYRVHFEGSFVVALREKSEAEEVAQRMMKAARAKGFPLRVTTEDAR
jgi:ATP-dependent Clp protease adapter protein ClpS